jgi:hypothetical protein
MRRLLRYHAESYPAIIRAGMGPPELDRTAVHIGYTANQKLLAVTTD